MQASTSEKGYRVVYGYRNELMFISPAAATPEEAIRLHGPAGCMVGVGVVYSRTAAGALKQARSCRFFAW